MEPDAPAASQHTLPESLTFAWLYQRVQRYVAESNRSVPSKLERWAFWFGIGMAGIGLAVVALSSWFPPAVVVNIAVVCLIAELAGLATSVGLMLKRELPQFMRPRETHATEMDADFAKWQSIVTELRHFPRPERETRLRFVTDLRHGTGERMGLVFGSIQRLGIFPVLIALYLQFRDWKWGDWAGAFDVNLLAGLIILAMLLLYAVGWLLIGIRSRLDSYVALLENSLRESSAD